MEKDPQTDVSLTVKNFTEQKEFKENQVYPEENSKLYNSKVIEKLHNVHLILRSQVSLLVAVILG